jgi:SAM-dependent methyltransferase
MQIVGLVPYERKVLDIGCGKGLLYPFLLRKKCDVSGIDILPQENIDGGALIYKQVDLEITPHIPYPDETFDVIILADFIEHIRNPDAILNEVRRTLKPDGRIIISTGNIALWLYRILLLFGSFPYGRQGILDETHVHLYTLSTFSQLIRRAGFKILKKRVAPIPFELIIKNKLGEIMNYAYYILAKLWKRFFAYQFILVCIKEELITNFLTNGQKVEVE